MKPTAEQKITQRIQKHFKKGVVTYDLLADGDKILVGLSGGKDSLALLELLAARARVHKPKIEVEAIHVRMTNIAYESDTQYLEDFAQNLGVKLIVCETSFDATTDNRKSPCFLCSWNRRKMLFTIAQERGCNKIALGHHQDDILHTTLMNLTFQGQFSTMPARITMRKFPITIIRPLCLVHEADLIKYAQFRDYKKQKKLCPYEKETNRAEVKELFRRIESLNPEARYSMWNALENDNKLIEE